MAKFINGRWVTDAELYPEQFEDLPEEALPKARKRSVRLDDIGEEGEECGKSQEKTDGKSLGTKKPDSTLTALLGGTAPAWKNRDAVKDTVNPRETASEEETVEKIYSKKRKETAKAYAMKTVASSTVTERKLRDKLKLREYTDEDIEDAVEYVKKFGYVNDTRVAQSMVEKLAARLWGRFKICYYLKGKGITEEVIESLDFSEVDFPYYCARLIKKYPADRRDAMLRAVKNAGYTSDDLRKARELLDEEL